MRLLISMLSILGGLPGLLQACSCAKGLTPCNTFATTPVVVVGKVVRDSGGGLGSGPGRVVIEEVLKGLDKEVRELEVDSSAMSSCYMRLKLDERYLLYGSLQGGVLQNHVCSGSRLGGEPLLLGALRAAAAQSAPRLIGAVEIAASEYGAGRPAEPGVRIVAEQGNRRLEARIIHDGQFEFPNIEPGEWKLRVDSPGLVHRDQWPSDPIQVPANGCEVRWLRAAQDGRIAGRVTNRDGQPVAGIPVQAFHFDRRGQMESSPYAEAKTDEGRYEIAGLPSEEYLVAINGRSIRTNSPTRLSITPVHTIQAPASESK
ncbi:MAG: carboxypeptidase regulatory-like domain-containing protein [Bryobacterales bacterium]|nr:carboxypeptidase regulatory-like domain-containing protein [Bryobacterales bacterium]